MTNEEKTKEIVDNTFGEFATSFPGYIDDVSEMFCECVAMKMAEWKDKQFKEYLEEKKTMIGHNNEERAALIDEIIDEFFE